MTEENNPNEPGKVAMVKPRPILLTLLCLISFVYFAVLILICFAGLFYSGWITTVTNQYISTENYSKTQILLLFGAGCLLHGLAFTGILLMWIRRKTGYYYLGFACLAIATYQLFNPFTAVTSTAIYILLLFLFGIFYMSLNPRASAGKQRKKLQFPGESG